MVPGEGSVDGKSPLPLRNADEPRVREAEEQGERQDSDYEPGGDEMQASTSPQDRVVDDPPVSRAVTSERTLSRSINAVRLAVLCDAATSFILDPNFPFMAIPDSHPDSFESTGPFGVTAATYFLAMTALLGSAIGSAVIGKISDRAGRKICIIACLGAGAVGAITNYLLRGSFWGFCVSNFIQGLFAASTPVAMAYVSDVKPGRKETDDEIGLLTALFVAGVAGGGISAIMLQNQGLFTPLFVGAALNTVALFVVVFFMIEPADIHRGPPSLDDEEQCEAPEKMNLKVLWTIVLGSLLDNIGSAGILPLAMAPLALKEFYSDFVDEGKAPLMTESAFKWLSVMAALTVVPGAGLSQVAFDRIGAAGGCVLGNLVTGIVTIAMLYIATIQPATYGTYGCFIVCLYVGFPFTVVSQISTGPMLDMIAPIDKRGFVQGINGSVMNFGTALAPYVLGEISDNFGIKTTMWICVGVSFAAALVNLPLVFVKQLKAQPRKPPKSARCLEWEDPQLVEHALNGKWVPARAWDCLIMERMRKGVPLLCVPFRSYGEDMKEGTDLMKTQTKQDLTDLINQIAEFIEELLSTPAESQAFIDQFKAAQRPTKHVTELEECLGRWFVDYVKDAGYWVEESPIVWKQMIMQAFPPITKTDPGVADMTVENIEESCINMMKVYEKFIDHEIDDELET